VLFNIARLFYEYFFLQTNFMNNLYFELLISSNFSYLCGEVIELIHLPLLALQRTKSASRLEITEGHKYRLEKSFYSSFGKSLDRAEF
jgi:hypothetical protein